MNRPDKALNAVIFFMLFANVFDMGGVFGIKYLSYLAGGVFLLYNYNVLKLSIDLILSPPLF